MSRRTEPVRHTCPDIDRMITKITSICNQMKNCNTNDSVENLIESIKDWEYDLNSIGVGRWCELEDLRSSNSSLREWGNEMYEDAESLESENDKLEIKCSELESEINYLNKKIENM